MVHNRMKEWPGLVHRCLGVDWCSGRLTLTLGSSEIADTGGAHVVVVVPIEEKKDAAQGAAEVEGGEDGGGHGRGEVEEEGTTNF